MCISAPTCTAPHLRVPSSLVALASALPTAWPAPELSEGYLRLKLTCGCQDSNQGPRCETSGAACPDVRGRNTFGPRFPRPRTDLPPSSARPRPPNLPARSRTSLPPDPGYMGRPFSNVRTHPSPQAWGPRRQGVGRSPPRRPSGKARSCPFLPLPSAPMSCFQGPAQALPAAYSAAFGILGHRPNLKPADGATWAHEPSLGRLPH